MKAIYILIIVLILSACQSTPLYEQKYQMATNAWEQGNKNEAITLLNESLQENPEFYEGRMELASYFHQLRQYKKAAEQYELCIELSPQDPTSWILGGESYLELARTIDDNEERSKTFLDAQHKFSNALNLQNLSKEGKFRATLGKGICLLQRTLKEDAREYIEDALRMQPNDISAKFYDAMLREHQLGPNQKSLDVYEKVLIWKPDHLEALQQMGDVFKKLGLHQKAFDYYKKFLNLGGQSANIQEWINAESSKMQANQGEPQEKEVIMVCPSCGRFGKKGQKTCDFDDTELVSQEKS